MTHRRGIFGLLVVLLLAATAAYAEGTLTEKKITAMTDAIEAAARRQDAGAIVRHFAPGATMSSLVAVSNRVIWFAFRRWRPP